MKIVTAVLAGLATATLVAGAALWIHSWTIVHWSGATFGYLQEFQERIEVDVSQRFKVGPDIILPKALTHLEGTTRHQCADLYAYSGACCGFALMLSTLAVLAWRRQKLRHIELQTSESAVPSRPEVRSRPTKKEGVFTRVFGIGKKQSMSTH